MTTTADQLTTDTIQVGDEVITYRPTIFEIITHEKSSS